MQGEATILRRVSSAKYAHCKFLEVDLSRTQISDSKLIGGRGLRVGKNQPNSNFPYCFIPP